MTSTICTIFDGDLLTTGNIVHNGATTQWNRQAPHHLKKITTIFDGDLLTTGNIVHNGATTQWNRQAPHHLKKLQLIYLMYV